VKLIWLVARREYRTRTTSPVFIVVTILMFLLLVGGPIVAEKISGSDSAKPILIQVIDGTGWALPKLQAALSATQAADPTQMTLIPADPVGQGALMDKAKASKVPGVLLLQGSTPEQFTAVFATSSVVTLERVQTRLQPVIRRLVTTERLSGQVDAKVLQLIEQPINVEYVQLTTGEKAQGYGVRTGLASIFTSLIYVAILAYGMQTFQGVLEEKSSRVMEVLISTVPPGVLMSGKVLGIGLVGMTQMASWGVAYAILRYIPMMGTSTVLSKVNGMIFVYMFIYFILAFFFYASLYAGLGSTVSRMEDSQSVITPLTVLVVVGQFVSLLAVQNPNGALAMWCSLIPFFAAPVMIARIALSEPPLWQIATSIGILFGSMVGTLWVGARIYRVGVLLYGSRPTVPMILRYLKSDRKAAQL
jgi:ABC-2 type transport system permease protein